MLQTWSKVSVFLWSISVLFSGAAIGIGTTIETYEIAYFGSDYFPALLDIERSISLSLDIAGGYQPIAWSPDGSHLILIGRNMMLVSDDRGNIVLLQDSAAQPSWSPDSSQIAFLYPNIVNQNSTVHTIYLDGSNLEQLPVTLLAWAEPYWSPDGSYIALHRGGNIVVVDSQTGTTIAAFREHFGPPQWLNDGQTLILRGAFENTVTILAANVLTRETYIFDERLLEFPSIYDFLVSPNERYAIFLAESNVPNRLQLMLMNLESVAQLPIEIGQFTHRFGSMYWSADGQRLALSFEEQIYIVDLDEPFTMRPVCQGCFYPVFRP